MKRISIPYSTVILSILTLAVSFYAAYDIGGSFFGRVRIVQLENYGAVTLDHIKDFELWRLFTSQLIHVKQFHMLYNVLSLFIIGAYIERHIGFVRLLLLWFVSGATGTLFSTLFVSPPWNLGTGASQAIMGMTAAGAVLLYKKVDTSIGLKIAIGFALIPALTLDFIFAHYPKPGHVLGFLIGLAISFLYMNNLSSDNAKYANKYKS